MPVSVTHTPIPLSPAYNPIYFTVDSNNTSQQGFNYIFDLYINGSFVVRDRLLPRPGVTSTIYSPARILESYVSFDKSQNLTGITASTNCIDEYTVNFGEEYLNYWYFNNISSTTGPFSAYTTFTTTGTTANPFISGDTVFIQQNSGYTFGGYNGVSTVLDFTSTSIIVNIPYVSSSSLGGSIIYSDKRKTIFTGNTELLPDPNFLNQSFWTTYGPDASNNSIALNGSGQLNWQQYSASTFINKYTQAIGVTFSSGTVYTVTYEVFDTFPALGPQYSFFVLGDATGTTNYGTGVFTESIVCGPGNNLKLYGGSTGTSLQGITFENISVKFPDTFSSYDFNGVLQYEQIPTWDFTTYIMQDSASKFLTNQPSTVKSCLSDRGSIGWLNWPSFTLSAANYFVVVTTNYDSGPGYPLLFPVPQMTGITNTNDIILEFPAYPWNLNKASQDLLAIDVIVPSTLNYGITLYAEFDPIGNPGIYTQISETKTFDMDCQCSKYEPVRFMFLNRLGQFDYFTANLLSRTNIALNRTTFEKTLGYNYQVGDRGKTVLSINAQESYQITCNWVNQDTSDWLVELFTSPEVYVLDNTTGALTPIVIDNSSIEKKKRVNDQLLNYIFNYTKAVEINTQRN